MKHQNKRLFRRERNRSHEAGTKHEQDVCKFQQSFENCFKFQPWLRTLVQSDVSDSKVILMSFTLQCLRNLTSFLHGLTVFTKIQRPPRVTIEVALSVDFRGGKFGGRSMVTRQ